MQAHSPPPPTCLCGTGNNATPKSASLTDTCVGLVVLQGGARALCGGSSCG